MIITQTPLRISFAGGGTDLASYYASREGFVVSTAIDKYAYVIVKERFDDLIYLNTMKKEIREDVSQIEHELIREAMRMTGVTSGVEVTLLSDIPSEGAGLGSSSSFTVGLLNAFYVYCGEQVTAEQLAQEACRIEIDVLGKPIGKQDQYIAAYGGLRSFRFAGMRWSRSSACASRTSNARAGRPHDLFFPGARAGDVIPASRRQHGGPQRRLDGQALAATWCPARARRVDRWATCAPELGMKRKWGPGISDDAIDGCTRWRAARRARRQICGAGGGGSARLRRRAAGAPREGPRRLPRLPFRLARTAAGDL